LIETRKTAAENSGDQAAAAAYSAQLMELDQDPNGLLLTALMPLAATMEPEEFDQFYQNAGLQREEDGFQLLPAEEVARLGLPAGSYQRGADGKITQIGSGGQTINVNTGAGEPQIGTIPQGFMLVEDATIPEGRRMVPIPGGPEDRSGSTAAGTELQAAGSSNVLDVLTDLKKGIEESPRLTTGFWGNILSQVPGSAAYDIEATSRTIKANLAFDALSAMRAASPTGGALGGVSAPELALLESQIASLDLGQSTPQILASIERIENQYTRILNKAYETGDPAELDRVLGGRPEFVQVAETPASRTRLRYNPETGTFD
jgi:hypothetical protein